MINIFDFVASQEALISQAAIRSGQINVLYHGDLDGVAAAAYICELAKRLGVRVGNTRPVLTSEFHFDFLESLLSGWSGLTISVDINFLGNSAALDTLSASSSEIIVIDDHLVPEYADPNFLYINPNFGNSKDAIDLPSSLFASVMFENVSQDSWRLAETLGLYYDRQLRRFSDRDNQRPDDQALFAIVKILSAPYFHRGVASTDDVTLALLRDGISRNVSWEDLVVLVEQNRYLQELSEGSQREIDQHGSLSRSGSKQTLLSGVWLTEYTFESDFLITNIVSSNMRRWAKNGIQLAANVKDGNHPIFNGPVS